MARKRDYKFYTADFETTVYEGQTYTEVWAAGLCELGTDHVKIHHSIDEFMDDLLSGGNKIVYFHNLGFDGSFILDYVQNILTYTLAAIQTGAEYYQVEMLKPDKMPPDSYNYMISDAGKWYQIRIMHHGFLIEFRDSYKLIPLSLENVAESFNTSIRKESIEYTGFRYAGCPISAAEEHYLKNDVKILAEALSQFFADKEQRKGALTIGSCCLKEFRYHLGENLYGFYFPNLLNFELDEAKTGCRNVDEYIRRGFRGGWFYAVPGKIGKVLHEGITLDVNSLYPYMMHSESGNIYPSGPPHYFSGRPDEWMNDKKFFYYVRIRCSFYLKNGKLPFISVKNSWMHHTNEMLESSDVRAEDGSTSPIYKDFCGNWVKSKLELTLTSFEFSLFLENYNVFDLEYLDGIWFHAAPNVFDDYINKYREMKMSHENGIRTIAKLFQNNLFGKFASNPRSSFKYAYKKGDTSIGFLTVDAYDKDPGYIAIGAAVTSYARCYMVRIAQKNFYGADKPGFAYCATDSLHLDGIGIEDVKGCTLDAKKYGCFKHETSWSIGIFAGAQRYIEKINDPEGDWYNIRCAGLPERARENLRKSLEGYRIGEGDKLTEEEKQFINERHTIDDFKPGLKIPGVLKPKRIPGGVILENKIFEVR